MKSRGGNHKDLPLHRGEVHVRMQIKLHDGLDTLKNSPYRDDSLGGGIGNDFEQIKASTEAYHRVYKKSNLVHSQVYARTKGEDDFSRHLAK